MPTNLTDSSTPNISWQKSSKIEGAEPNEDDITASSLNHFGRATILDLRLDYKGKWTWKGWYIATADIGK
jgi:hypothetical protein